MTQDTNEIKQQRDRFLAFSFATSDLFLEVNQDDKITFALGAAKGLTGIGDKDLIDIKWLDLFSFEDIGLLSSLRSRSKVGQRVGPLFVNLADKMGGRSALLHAIKLPDNDNFYITLGLSNELMNKLKGTDLLAISLGDVDDSTTQEEAPAQAMNKDDYISATQEILIKAKTAGRNLSMSLFDLGVSPEEIERIGKESWGAIEDFINDILLSESFDGKTASKISEGKYSFLHNDDLNMQIITEKIDAMLNETEPKNKELNLQSHTLDSDLSSMSAKDATKAVLYTINEFEKKGSSSVPDSLNDSFENFAEGNKDKIQQLEKIIESSDFKICFQPVVVLKDASLLHYEIFSRFNGGSSQEWMTLAEDTGLAPQYDIALIDRALSFIQYKAGGTSHKFSVNISSTSIQNMDFIKDLFELIDRKEGAERRLSFEITGSYDVKDLEKVALHIQALKQKGFEIILDDFGSGTDGNKYIKEIKPEYVKISGKYIENITTSHRDVDMIKNITEMCKQSKTKIIAKNIEEKEQSEVLMKIGVNLGQGYLFSEVTSKPEYIPPINFD